MPTAQTLYDKIINRHRIQSLNGVDGAGEEMLLYIDRTVLNEYTSPQAFHGMRQAKRPVLRPKSALGVVDHVNSTDPARPFKAADADARTQIDTFISNGKEFDIEIFDIFDPRQGIEHVVLPELGWVLPGMVIAAGDSHTTTYGAFGCVGFGIGTSDIEHLLATQTLRYKRLRNMRVRYHGDLAPGLTSKDMIMALIRQIGADGAVGCALEICGGTVTALGVEARMTMCNMAVECGARVAVMAPDDKVFDHIKGRPRAPQDKMLDKAQVAWKVLRSDSEANFDTEIVISAAEIEPMVSWGISPDQAVTVRDTVPDPDTLPLHQRSAAHAAIEYMGLTPGTRLSDIRIDRAFIGSCTNARISDLRQAANILRNRRVAAHVRAMISPGSSTVRRQAESEGLDRIFIDAGFEWRESGCSMCLAMNDDMLAPGERCASSTNRNFRGRQGVGGRTHLMSPAMVACAAIAGHLADVRDFLPKSI